MICFGLSRIAQVIRTALELKKDNPSSTFPSPLSTIQLHKKRMAEQRLETLYTQLETIRSQHDLETRVEEQMHLR